MLKLARFLKPYLPLAVLAVVFLFAQAFAELYLPNLMAEMIDVGVKQGDLPFIVRVGARMLGVALFGGLAAMFVSFAAAKVAAGVTRDVRREVFASVCSFSSEEFDRFSTASLITRTTNDVNQLTHLILMGLRMMCFAPVMGIGSIVLAVQKSPSMSWILVLAVVVVIAVISSVFSLAMPRFRLAQKLVDRLNLVSREHLNGLMVIRAFGTQEFEKGRFAKANDELTAVNLFVNRIMVVLWPAMSVVMNCVSLLVVWVGAHRVASSGMLVGDMMAYMQYGMHVVFSFMMLSMMFILIPRAAVSAQRIAEVLGTGTSIRDPDSPAHVDPARRGFVEFRDVSFRYRGAEEDVLKSVSFTAKPGETTAFIGATGSGKTTLVNLIPRFYDVTAGEILVSGADVRRLSLAELRDQIGFVPQKGTLMSGTVASNLRYGKPDATDGEIREASRVAQAASFVEAMAGGYDAMIAEGGTNVSGGQKQRLSIARALVKKPPVYVFDDTFSALDFKTDAALRAALRKFTGDATVLIVAQRINTIMNADRIVVLDEGRVAGIGTHRELLANCDIYREIAESQLTGEELQ
jgi:ATP-binding cassette, subfamily B, multidrug efflux pump